MLAVTYVKSLHHVFLYYQLHLRFLFLDLYFGTTVMLDLQLLLALHIAG